MRRPGALLLAAALLGAGCSRPQIRLLAPDDVVVAFGDSLTSGVDATRDDAYPAHLARILGRTVVNAGVPGERAEEGLARLPGVLDEYRPALLILCHGGNNLLQKDDPRRIEAALDAMIALARDRGSDVILLGVPRPGLRLRTAAFYGSLARKHRVPYEGRIVRDVLSERSLRSDPAHPNTEGNRRMAEAIARLIERAQP